MRDVTTSETGFLSSVTGFHPANDPAQFRTKLDTGDNCRQKLVG